MSQSLMLLPMSGAIPTIVLASGGVCFLYLIGSWIKKGSGLPLPPGPKGWPIIGNVFDIPRTALWKTFHTWSGQYGDVLYLNLPAQPTVVLGSTKAAIDLMEKRSHICSDRQIYIMDDLMAWDFNVGFMPYSARWRNHRKYFHQFFQLAAMPQYQPVQLSEARKFLRRTLQSQSEDLAQSIRLIYVAIILRITYGISVDTLDDEYVRLNQEATLALSTTRLPGVFWIEYFPFLKLIPAWVPGAKFRQHCDLYRPTVLGMKNKPFDDVQGAMAKGEAPVCVAAQMIRDLQDNEAIAGEGLDIDHAQQEEIARNTAGVAYAASVDTVRLSLPQ